VRFLTLQEIASLKKGGKDTYEDFIPELVRLCALMQVFGSLGVLTAIPATSK